MVKNFKKRSGFTLIEMTVVLFIISLLILIIIPNISRSRTNAENKNKDAMVSVVQTQVDSYLNDHDNSQKAVTFGDLKSNGYLSNQQCNKANHYGIHIHDNKVTK